MRSVTQTFTKGIFVLSLLLALSSCRLSLLPGYNEQIATQIDTIARQVDHLYLNMLEYQKPEGRVYQNYQAEYVNIELELNSLYRKNLVRPLNKESARNCQLALKIWRDYKQQHKDKNTLSDALIELNRTYMNDIFYTIQTGEEAKR